MCYHFIVLAVLEYNDPRGQSPIRAWFDGLNTGAAVRVTVALTRMHQGNLGDHKGVGAGVHECRINFGPGYRIYFGKDGAQVVILLGGGTKQKQRKTSRRQSLVGMIIKRAKR